MPTMTPTIDTGLLSRLPAGPILMRVRRLIVTTGIAAFAYTVLSSGSAASCSGGGTSADGAVTQATCANLALRPSWAVYAALAVIVFVAIGRVARRAETLEAANRILDRTAIVIVAVVLVSAAVGLTWIMLVRPESLTGGGTVLFPFPFSSAELTITHQ
ncbi:hypothetical protein [Leifsonia sp. C5G2]|uniref:hypothetical protein n=1 Tax=Leifsonia sp. C5G2 TaxID=2735269 RepID=UPI001584F7AA|nr:hypothetical protein [Leifsonia sp. C5G2]NUU07830.1 hypothetical protein [Leifsonia sp. C5G2]